MAYCRISESERERINIYLQKGYSQAEIAKELGRNQSSVSRELKKGRRYNAYSPVLAQNRTNARAKLRKPRLIIRQETRMIIANHMAIGWSPRQISSFLQTQRTDDIVNVVSEKTIYNYINLHMKGELKKLALEELRQKGKKRSHTPSTRGRIPNMVLIDERPQEVGSREIPGHWEGDLIIGDDHKSALSVIVERKTRYVMIERLLSYDANTVRKSIERRFKSIEPELRKSITVDQGKEMSEHEILARNIKMKVYFCNPHSPWEKGTCENTNYLIRDMCRDVTDFRELTQQQAHKIARLLNERPRQTLGFKTPKEKFNELCTRIY
jgi:Transposase and inactivated derivatives, IS30 family